MAKYCKKPVVIEAIQAMGTPESNREIIEWTRGSKTPASMETNEEGIRQLSISTLEGSLWVSLGDYVIKGVAGEFYPCKPEIFAITYRNHPMTPTFEDLPVEVQDVVREAHTVARNNYNSSWGYHLKAAIEALWPEFGEGKGE